MAAALGNKYAVGNSGGRPERVPKPKDIKAAAMMAKLGGTDHEIAQGLGIGLTTFYRWRSRHKEFQDALKGWDAIHDDRVERSLYQLANGYFIDVEKPLVVKGKVVKVNVREYVPPHFGAASRWLANRKRKQWSQAGNNDEAQVSLLELVMLSYSGDRTMPRPRELVLQANKEPPEGSAR